MPSKSKSKGNRFERAIVDTIQQHISGREAQRAWGSNGEALGMHAEVDLIFSEKHGGDFREEWNKTYKVQAKCRKSIAKFLKPSENVDMQIVKEDRGTTYAIIELDKLLELIT
tara:strand:- start:2014 stop:2352 length:339 start_codon:yes stop_codon:yes gene_type:complete